MEPTETTEPVEIPTEIRVLKSLPRRIFDAAFRATISTVVLWLAFSALGHPTWAAHHLTAFYLWTGFIFALGKFVSADDAAHLPGTKRASKQPTSVL